jgi:hypothetical protein
MPTSLRVLSSSGEQFFTPDPKESALPLQHKRDFLLICYNFFSTLAISGER